MLFLVRFVLLVLLVGASAAARSEGEIPAVNRTVWSYTSSNAGGESARIYSSGSAACAALADFLQNRYNVPVSSTFNAPADCKVCSTTEANCGALGYYSVQSYTGVGCPDGTSQSGASCSCPSGTQPNSAGTACVPSNACSAKAGTSEQRNFTIGWSRTSGAEQESAWDASVLQRGSDLIGTTVCDGTCLGAVSANNQSNAWQATQPNSQGLYRLSVDYTVTYTGGTCTASQKSASMDPAAPAPSCDGYLGQINGKPACVGKPGTSDPKVTAPSPVLAGNPAAGSAGTDPGRTGGAGGSSGGPSSPSDGQIRGGSGSPTNGSGGTGSSATGDKEIKIEMCGSKGQPACKIDESGTPDGKGAFSSADAALESSSKAREAGIRDAGDRKSLPWSPSGILLPTAGCEVQRTETRFGVMPLDLCNSPIAQLWRQLLGWLLYMLTLLYCWRVAGGSIGGGK